MNAPNNLELSAVAKPVKNRLARGDALGWGPQRSAWYCGAPEVVVQAFEAAVDQGLGDWWMNESGAAECHMQDGTAFEFTQSGLKRIR